MTVNQVLTTLDELTPNTFSTERKLQWLAALEGQLYEQVITRHEGTAADAPGPLLPETVLLVEDPYSELYVLYLQAKVAQANSETERFNDAAAAYDSALRNYCNALRRAHMPVSDATRWRVL